MYVLFYFGQLSHFHSSFDAGLTNLNEPPFEIFAPFPLLQVELAPFLFRAIVNEAMRDEGVIYVTGRPLLNWRCTSLRGCIFRNDLCPVGC